MVTCSRCRAQQPATLRFCTTCGNTLAAPAASPSPAFTPAPVAAPSAGPGFGQSSSSPGFAQAAAAAGFGAPSVASFGSPSAMTSQPTPAAEPPVAAFGNYPSPSRGSPMARELAESQGAVTVVCWRCRGAGDAGHDFCKFCGARYADAPAGQAAPAASPPLAAPQPGPMRAADAGAGGGGSHSTAVMSAAPATALAAARLVSILKDGSDGQAFPLAHESLDIGRQEGEVVLADDPYLSLRHARVRRQGDQYFVRDLDSVNGVYFRLREAVEFLDGDLLLVGQQVLRLEVLDDVETPFGPAGIQGVLVFGTPESPRVARLMQYTTEGLVRDVFYLYRNETVIGRENGDIVFTDDPFLSRRHAAVRYDRNQRRFGVADVGSSNGTFIRIRGERPLVHNDQFRVGRHLFRFEVTGQGAR